MSFADLAFPGSGRDLSCAENRRVLSGYRKGLGVFCLRTDRVAGLLGGGEAGKKG